VKRGPEECLGSFASGKSSRIEEWCCEWRNSEDGEIGKYEVRWGELREQRNGRVDFLYVFQVMVTKRGLLGREDV